MTRRFRAPGRVNLIGDHTDYNDGFALPIAIGQRTVVAAAKREDRKIRVRSLLVSDAAELDRLASDLEHQGTCAFSSRSAY